MISLIRCRRLKNNLHNISRFLTRHWQIVLIVLMSCVPFLWYRPGFILAVGDNLPFWLHPVSLSHELSLWQDFNGGEPTTNPLRLTYAVLVFLFEHLGMSMGLMQVVFQVLYFLSAGLGVYYLARRLYPKGTSVALVAALFYMFNVFVLLLKLNIVLNWSYALLPWFLFVFIRFLDRVVERKSTAKFVLIFLLLSAFGLPMVALNAAYLVVIGIGLLVVLLYMLWTYRTQARRILVSTGTLFVLTLGACLWWLYVLAVNYGTFFGVSGYQAGTELDVLNWTWVHSRSSLLNNFWFNTSWAWREEYYTFFDQYSSPLLVILTFVPILLAFGSVLLSRRAKGEGRDEKGLTVYLALWVLILLFFAKGIHDPLREINVWIYEHVPFFELFRDPRKFQLLIVLLVALLIGVTVDGVLQRLRSLRNRWRRMVLESIAMVVVVEIFLLTTFPLLSGEVIREETAGLPFSSYIQVPEYWEQAGLAMAAQDPTARVLMTPGNDSYQMPYTWGFAGADLIALRLFTNPVLQQPLQYIVNTGYQDLIGLVYQKIQGNQRRGLEKLLQLLNVRYVVQRNDIDHTFRHRAIADPESMRAFLQTEDELSEGQTFGKLDLYEVETERGLVESQAVYIPEDIVYVQPVAGGNIRSLNEVAELLDPERSSAIFSSDLNGRLAERITNDPRTVTAVTAAFREQLASGVQEYQVTVPHSGEYSLTISKNNSLIQEVWVDETVTPFKDSAAGTTIFLARGDHTLRLIPFPGVYTGEATLQNGSFEDGLWNDVGDCNRYDTRSLTEAEISADLSSDATDGEYSLELQARHHAACLSSEAIPNLKGHLLTLSFDYQAVSGTRGTAPRFCVWLEDIEQCHIYTSMDRDYEPNAGWKTYTTSFELPPISNTFQIYLYTFGNGRVTAVNRYDRVTLSSRLDFGDLTLHRKVEDVPETPPPTFSVSQVSPTKYTGQVVSATEPFFLVLSQSFHPFWHLTVDGENISPDEHHVVNSFANAWYIEKTGDMTITIEYVARRYFFWACSISLWIILMVSIVSFRNRKEAT